ncbi:hypothetical protein [Granulicoccus sp. GXG6511]|uniref:hypothetical protein n=1 Tax=Granulicoccus sp. GXG6511 TaxID=3381351 RepID=UPI003D7E8CD7
MKEKQHTASQRPAVDRFSLVVGLLFCSFAGGALYAALGGNLDPRVWNVALPVFLVALGIIGLVLARRT